MAYATRSAYMDMDPTGATVPGRDAWIDNMARFMEFAGWTKEVVGSFFEIETTLEALSYLGFGCNLANDIFWKVTRLSDGVSRIVGDGNPGTHTLDWPFIATGDISIPSTHAGVVTAILQLFPSFTPITISSTKTRFITDVISNSFALVNIGASLHTTVSSPHFGGYLMTSAPNQRIVAKNGLPVTYGAGNWIKLLLAQRLQPFGDIVIAASKGFLSYPPDTPQAPDGVGPLTGVRTLYTGWNNDRRTYAFATPHSLVAHTPTPGPPASDFFESHLEVAGLDLIDFRRSSSEDLPVEEAVFFAGSIAASGNADSFHRSCRASGSSGGVMVDLNGAGRFNQATDNKGEPQLVLLHSARSGGGAVSDNNGVPWENSCPAGPFFEPWIAFNPFDQLKPGAIMGQFPDLVTVYQVYAAPQAAGTFAWDGQTWRPYTQNGTQSRTNRPTGTVCLRVTDTFVP